MKIIDLGTQKMDLTKDIYLSDSILINFQNLDNKEKEMVRTWRNNESIMKWMYQDHNITEVEHNNFIIKLKEDTKNLYWLLKNISGEYIGVISLNRIDFRNKNAYLGIYSNPESKLHAGKLIISSVKELISNVIPLHTLKIEVIDNNERAINFYKKSGFNEEGRLKEFIHKNGEWHDAIVMGIINTSLV